MGAVLRVRSAASFGIHQFFKDRDFFLVNTPILTTNDCEGAGELFQVSTSKAAKKDHGPQDPSQPGYFGQPTFLTVSGQLHAEIVACALSKVYTFGPTFRAEDSNTKRHLSEFWMLEAEQAHLNSLEELTALARDNLKATAQYVLSQCPDEVAFFNQWVEPVGAKVEKLVKQPFSTLSYTDAITQLQKKEAEGAVKFQFKPKWGDSLQTEHERYITDTLCDKTAVFVTDYPKAIKPFYMRVNSDDKTVAAFDLLVPGIGELVGGSLREERYQVLEARMAEQGVNPETLRWYLDLRKYGTVPHGGYGMGFERLILFLSGVSNIRDATPFPRTPGHCLF